jgi:Plavaka transposase
LPDGSQALPPLITELAKDDYYPYESRAAFELADFLFWKDQMSGKKVGELMDIWATYQQSCGEELDPPYAGAKDLYNTIDVTEVGDVPWQAFSVQFNGDIPPNNPPPWMTASYEVWFHDPLWVMEGQLGNKDFGGEIDVALKWVFSKEGKHQFVDLMTGNWAWDQAVKLSFLRSIFWLNPSL